MLRKFSRTYDFKKLADKVIAYGHEHGAYNNKQLADLIGISATTMNALLAFNAPATSRPVDKTAQYICEKIGIKWADILPPKAPPVTKTIVSAPLKEVQTEVQKESPKFETRAKWQIGITVDESKDPNIVTLCLNKNGAVYAYAKAKLINKGDLGFAKDLSYCMHQLYKNAEQRSL